MYGTLLFIFIFSFISLTIYFYKNTITKFILENKYFSYLHYQKHLPSIMDSIVYFNNTALFAVNKHAPLTKQMFLYMNNESNDCIKEVSKILAVKCEVKLRSLNVPAQLFKVIMSTLVQEVYLDTSLFGNGVILKNTKAINGVASLFVVQILTDKVFLHYLEVKANNQLQASFERGINKLVVEDAFKMKKVKVSEQAMYNLCLPSILYMLYETPINLRMINFRDSVLNFRDKQFTMCGMVFYNGKSKKFELLGVGGWNEALIRMIDRYKSESNDSLVSYLIYELNKE